MNDRARWTGIVLLVALLVYSKSGGAILPAPDTVPVSFDGRYVLMVDTLTSRTPEVSNYMASKDVRDFLAANTDGFRHWYSDANPANAPQHFRELMAIGAPKAPTVVASQNRRASLHPVPKTGAEFKQLVGGR